ncbi:MAG TPA: hypothetical protein P5246_05485 [Candidatus Omnitrophota bacterium]|nr:hypothetical protein [Candidatus Omnitrophota bacterium]
MVTFDTIFLSILAVFFLMGWHLGFLRNLIGPMSFGLCLLFAVINYDLNSNLLHSIAIAVLGTIILSFTINLTIMISRHTVSKKYRSYVFWGSRLLGGALSVLWRGTITAGLVLLIMTLPNDAFQLKDIQANIELSKTYSHIQTYLVPRFPILQNTFTTLSVFSHPEQFTMVDDSPQYADFFNNPHVKDILSDPEIANDIRNNNIKNLITNKKIQALLKDQKSLKTIEQLSKEIYRRKVEETSQK